MLLRPTQSYGNDTQKRVGILPFVRFCAKISLPDTTPFSIWQVYTWSLSYPFPTPNTYEAVTVSVLSYIKCQLRNMFKPFFPCDNVYNKRPNVHLEKQCANLQWINRIFSGQSVGGQFSKHGNWQGMCFVHPDFKLCMSACFCLEKKH